MKKWIVATLVITAFLYYLILPLEAKQVNAPKGGLPVNVTIFYLDSTVTIGWDEVTNTLQYYIYSQDDPYGEFTLIDSTTSTTWNGNYAQNKKFFYVTAEVNSIPAGFVFVQGGAFTMGDNLGDGYSDELPLHDVTLSDFYMGATEVTQAEWSQYMPAGSWSSSYGVGDTYPAYYVSWYEVIKYCNLRSIAEGLTPCYTIGSSTDPADWGTVPTSSNSTWDAVACNWSANGYRLPSEAEWEYAARGGIHSADNLRYSGCNLENDLTKYAWYSANSGSSTHPVGTNLPNQLGLYDMSGNLYEWCWDWYGSYTSDSFTNPYGPTTGSYRVLRGGLWYVDASFCRVAHRYFKRPYVSYIYYGFRISRTP